MIGSEQTGLGSVLTAGGRRNAFADGDVVCFISDEIDFTLPPGTIVPFGGNWPSLPGLEFAPNLVRIFMTNIAATTFLASGNTSLGNNAAANNICPAANQPVAATLNSELAAGAGGTYNHSALAASGVVKLPDLATPPTVAINTPVTGTAITQCRGRIVAWGLLTSRLPVTP